MSDTNFRGYKFRAMMLAFLMLIAGIIVWMVGGFSKSLPTKSDDTKIHSSSSSGVQSSSVTSEVKADKALRREDASILIEKPVSTTRAPKDLSWMHSMVEMLQQAPQSNNAASRSFAVYMPSVLCLSLSTARNVGHISLKSDVPSKSIPYNERGLERIARRCSEYSGTGIDKLRVTVIAGLKAENAPLTAFFSSMNGPPEAARTQLARVLADHDATALQSLGISWPFLNAERLTVTLPDELKPYAQGITNAAFDIALCRAGASCEADSVALDLVCAKFGECDVTDVENAYRRLHSAAGIPFDETSRMADWILDAIRRRDAGALWPDTVRSSGTRK
jgi:hypothetical protein